MAVVSLNHSLNMNPLETDHCRDTSLFKNQGMFYKRRWPGFADGPAASSWQSLGPLASWPPWPVPPKPHPCHAVKYISCLSQLIDSLPKGKLILGQRSIKPPEEE